MPIYKAKNENFFKKWSSEMAYILGFFVADGSLTINSRGSQYIDFCITDKDLLLKIRKALDSNHKIGERRTNNKNHKTVYRLQIGSKRMFNDLLKKGVRVDKTGHEVLPKVPKKYFKDFIRGYFDGDGTVCIIKKIRKDRKNKLYISLMTSFTCLNKNFLVSIRKRLNPIMDGGGIYYFGNAWRLKFSTADSGKLYKFMYNKKDRIFLKRKKDIFEKFINQYADVA